MPKIFYQIHVRGRKGVQSAITVGHQSCEYLDDQSDEVVLIVGSRLVETVPVPALVKMSLDPRLEAVGRAE